MTELQQLSLIELNAEVDKRFSYWLANSESEVAYQRYIRAQRVLIEKIRIIGKMAESMAQSSD